MPEIAAFKNGRNGFSFRHADAASLARTLADALAEPSRLTEMSAVARQTTDRSYNVEDMVRRFLSAVAAAGTSQTTGQTE